MLGIGEGTDKDDHCRGNGVVDESVEGSNARYDWRFNPNWSNDAELHDFKI